MINTLCSKSHCQPDRNSWAAKGTAHKVDADTIGRADEVDIQLNRPGAEDALLVVGIALAKGVKMKLTAPDRTHLPWFLQDADLSYPGSVDVFETEPQKPADRSPVDPDVYKAQDYDTFIGCLMSGLSKKQYAEGRDHLLAIHQTLQQTSDSQDNYCEGINIGSNESFGTPKEALVIDMEAIKGSENCVFYQYDNSSRPSGMWVELGAALALDKPCTLLTPDLNGVPPAVRKGLPNLRVVQYDSHENFKNLLKKSPEQILN
jgi:hypothetical protein